MEEGVRKRSETCCVSLTLCICQIMSLISYCVLFFLERDLFGAEPFDPFSCGAGDFPPDIQSKLDEMQVIQIFTIVNILLSSPCKHWALKSEIRSYSRGNAFVHYGMFPIPSATDGDVIY